MRHNDAGRPRARPTGPLAATLVLGLFGSWFKRDPPPAADAPKPRVVLEGMSKAPTIPPPKQDVPPDLLMAELRYKALHADINPSQSVRPGEMTCPNCERHFRYFMNANGTKTVVKCPGCAKTYRV